MFLNNILCIVITNFNFNVAAECHAKLILRVFGEDSLKRLLEQRRVERITHHHVTSTHIQSGEIAINRANRTIMRRKKEHSPEQSSKKTGIL